MSGIQPVIKRKPVEELFIFKKLVYEPSYKTHLNIDRTDLHIQGPLCPNCKSDLALKKEPAGDLECLICDFEIANDKTQQELRELAYKAYEAKQRSALKIISLDLPPGAVKAENEDEDYWIEARIGQRHGRLQGMILMGRKIKEQSKKDYAQIILDPEDEQMRFDKGNQHPLELLSKIEVTFQGSKIVQEEQKTKDVKDLEKLEDLEHGS